METKEMKIQVPEGYEIDKENSTFECIKLKPIKKVLNYEDVINELFKGNERYVYSFLYYNSWRDAVCTSNNQIEKLIAINKLMNVAKYLNGSWSPDWDNESDKYFIYYSMCKKTSGIDCTRSYNQSIVYFKSKELAEQAIEILGEETIKTALSTDW